jgi:hypothetical protein
MAKFVVLAREAFIDLIRGLGSKGSGFGPDVQRMFKSYQNNRSRIASHYKKSTGKVVPEGKVVVPSELHRALKQESFVKKASQQTGKQMGDEEKFFERLGKPMKKPREASFTREQPKRDRSKGPLFPMKIGKRTYEEGQRRLTLKAEREAAKSGRKINRTKYVTSRDLDEDTF